MKHLLASGQPVTTNTRLRQYDYTSIEGTFMTVYKYKFNFNRGHPVIYEFRSNARCFKVTVKTQQQCINIIGIKKNQIPKKY
jgi:hypothetical protein